MPMRYRRRASLVWANEGQAPTGTEPVVEVPNPTPDNPTVVDPPADTPANPSPPEPKVFDEAYVKGLRTENANARIKNNELQARLEEYERKERTELENLTNDVNKFKTEIIPTLEQDNRKLRVQVEAAKLGIVDPEVAAMLIDWKAVETGTPVAEALESLLNARPYLKQTTQTATTPAVQQAQTPTTPQTPTQSNPASPAHEGKKTFTKNELDRMSPEQVAAQMDDIYYALENGLIDFTK